LGTRSHFAFVADWSEWIHQQQPIHFNKGTAMKTITNTAIRSTRPNRLTKTVIASLVIAGAVLTAAPQANAALPTCNALRKGRIVGTQVCSVKNGNFRWVKVVAPTVNPADGIQNIPAPAASTAGMTRYSASDNSWTVMVPSTWKATPIEGSVDFGLPAGRNILFFAPGNNSHVFTFSIATSPKPSKSPEAELADWATYGDLVVLDQKVSALNGLPMISMTDQRVSDTSFKERKVLIYRNTEVDGFDGAISIRAEWNDGLPETAKRKAELNAILASVQVTP
jgi:hypothetical protein